MDIVTPIQPAVTSPTGRTKKFWLIAFGAIVVLAVISFLYLKTTLRTEISEFTLAPVQTDAAGITPDTAFTLKSSADLSAAVIKSHLIIAPEISFDVRKDSAIPGLYEILPVDSLAVDTVYTVSVPKGPIAIRDFSWAYQVKAPFQIISTLPRDQGVGVPVDTVIEITFNRENLENPGDFIRITPDIPGRFETNRNVVTFVPHQRLLSQTLYTVSVNPGIKSRDSDDSLVEAKSFAFETSRDYQSASQTIFNFSRSFQEFAPGATPSFDVSAWSVPGNKVSVSVYELGSLSEFLESYRKSAQGGSAWSYYHTRQPVAFPAETKIIAEAELLISKFNYSDIVSIPGDWPEGFYVAEAKVGKRISQIWFQITPVVTFSTLGARDTLVWAKDSTDGGNISGAELSFNGKILGVTNQDGVVVVQTPSELVKDSDEPDAFYYASVRPSDFFILRAFGREVALLAENEYGYFSQLSPPDKYWDYISTDKTIYLPTDTVRFWAVAKTRQGNSLAGESLTVTLTQAYWDGTDRNQITTLGETSVVASSFSAVTGELAFSNLRPGVYQLNLFKGEERLGTYMITVATYIKPAYKISVTPDRPAVFAGETVSYLVKAEFFDGTPVPNLKINYQGYLLDRITGTLTLDEGGEGKFSIPTNFDGKYPEYWPRQLALTLTPAVSEEGQISTEVYTAVFGPRKSLSSLQTVEGGKKVFNLEIKKVNLPAEAQGGVYWGSSSGYLGEAVPNWGITAKVYEILTHRKQVDTGYDPINKTSYPIYSYSTEELLKDTKELSTDNAGKAKFYFIPVAGKTYKLVFESKDENNRVSSQTQWAYGDSLMKSDPVVSGGRAIDYIYLVNLDHERNYRIGETSHLVLEANQETLPAGVGRFAYLKINNGAISYKLGSEASYSPVMSESDIPNSTLVGVWWNGQRFLNSSIVNFPLNPEVKRLSVKTVFNKTSYRPKDEVVADIFVKDVDGRPKSAEVNVSALDESVFSIRPYERDIVSELYKNIFSALIMRSSHLPPQGGGGAERGGGDGDSVRSDIKEIAVWQSVKTDRNGHAQITFKVPDNLTSWRLTTQAVTDDLFAGKDVSFVKVSLPFFVETALNRTYLAGDNLILRVRSFGDRTQTEVLSYWIKSSTLGFDKKINSSSRSAEISLGNLKAGEHKLIIEGRSTNYQDAIERSLSVVESYFTENQAKFYELKDGLSGIAGSAKGLTELAFSSYERGRLYSALWSVICNCGARFDQKITSYEAKRLLKEFFGEGDDFSVPNSLAYQTSGGGVSLFPYSEADLELSAKVANLGQDGELVNRDSLKKYLYSALSDKKADLSRIVRALYGLAAFHEPVLVKLQTLKRESGLDLADKIHLGLGLSVLGAKEEAKEYFVSEIKPSLRKDPPFISVSNSSDSDENIILTVLAATLAEEVSDETALGLADFATRNFPRRSLKNLEMLLYLKEALPKRSGEAVSFSYRIGDRTETKTLDRGETFVLRLLPADLLKLEFFDVKGKIGLVSRFEVVADPQKISPDNRLGLLRTYSVNGAPTKVFSEGDLVKVELMPNYRPGSLSGPYQVVDLLPSGLRPVGTELNSPVRSVYYNDSWFTLWPSLIEDQKVTFVTWDSYKRPLVYYARVVSKGTYKAEPALLQSLESLDLKTISNSDSVTID